MPTKALSFVDGLSEILQTIAKMRLSQDSDQAFLDDLQSVILAKGQAHNQGQQPGGPPGPGGPGGPPPGPPGQAGGPGGPPPSPQGPPPQAVGAPGPMQGNPANGIMPKPEMPPADELRRALSGGLGSS